MGRDDFLKRPLDLILSTESEMSQRPLSTEWETCSLIPSSPLFPSHLSIHRSLLDVIGWSSGVHLSVRLPGDGFTPGKSALEKRSLRRFGLFKLSGDVNPECGITFSGGWKKKKKSSKTLEGLGNSSAPRKCSWGGQMGSVKILGWHTKMVLLVATQIRLGLWLCTAFYLTLFHQKDNMHPTHLLQVWETHKHFRKTQKLLLFLLLLLALTSRQAACLSAH